MENDELVEVNPLFKEIAQREGFYTEELMKKIAKVGTVRDMTEVPERWRRIFRCAYDITPEAHIRMQAAFQKHTDNAVSKTVNFPKEARAVDVEEVFMLAYQLGCKGVTIYRDGSREAQVLNIGNVNRRRDAASTAIPRKRPGALDGKTHKKPTGCGNLYVTINDDGTRTVRAFRADRQGRRVRGVPSRGDRPADLARAPRRRRARRRREAAPRRPLSVARVGGGEARSFLRGRDQQVARGTSRRRQDPETRGPRRSRASR